MGWAAREERGAVFWGLHASFVLSSAPLHLFSWHSWFCEALSVSCFLFLTEASYSHILRHINSFFLVLPGAFSLRFFKTNVLFLYTLFSSTYICFFCLARCSLKTFPNFRWDALWGIYSDVTLPYLRKATTLAQIMFSKRFTDRLGPLITLREGGVSRLTECEREFLSKMSRQLVLVADEHFPAGLVEKGSWKLSFVWPLCLWANLRWSACPFDV